MTASVQTKKMDLKAIKCPTAMVYIRRAIENAVSQSFTGHVEIITIEPSVERDLTYFLASIDGNASIVKVIKEPLTDDLRNDWLSSGEALPAEIENITDKIHLTVEFK
ncbi:hypothetical protein [Moritella sp. F3]|uniref:hypothetical protein n=1 Tax=Moritella sp. F3 TaxID=2718882 RepID=UPI0018E1918E|nr:hypothetical protein [Moritella sp. F3]GIC77630.1 hypothetical protein FMO001_23570 [Moritella sp. F1]GIC82043.1 hypothetical protein FMO003_23240 [Moritella sp. F3]